MFPPPIDAVEGLCFNPPCVRASVRAYVRPDVCVDVCFLLLARYLINRLTEFHQTLVDGVVERRNELNRFWSWDQGQGHSEVK